MRATLTAPTRTGPITDAIRTMRAAVPGFDADPDLRALRRALADRIDSDLAVLDVLGGDPDLEPSLGAGEPYTRGPARDWSYGGDDREDDAGDSPEIENEHGADDDHGEPSLGSLSDTAHGDHIGQLAWGRGARGDREAGDDNGIADWGGECEQTGRFLAMGGSFNRLPSGFRA